MIKIGIISDTHKHIKRAIKAIDFLIEKKCTYFIHAGDIVQIEVISYLESLNIEYCAIFGNNDKHIYNKSDFYNIHHEPYVFLKKQKQIKLMHHPYYLVPSKEDIVIYGHTHSLIYEYVNNVLYLNPGEVCARDGDFSQSMSLEIKKDKYIVSCFNRKIKTKKWIEKKHIFEM
jgi:putative phosphoesterase